MPILPNGWVMGEAGVSPIIRILHSFNFIAINGEVGTPSLIYVSLRKDSGHSNAPILKLLAFESLSVFFQR